MDGVVVFWVVGEVGLLLRVWSCLCGGLAGFFRGVFCWGVGGGGWGWLCLGGFFLF